jgi:hypothetical protein
MIVRPISVEVHFVGEISPSISLLQTVDRKAVTTKDGETLKIKK